MEQTLTAHAAATASLDEAPAVAGRALTRQYGDGESAVHALRGVSIEIPAGQFAAVMGPSGSCKSTLTCDEHRSYLRLWVPLAEHDRMRAIWRQRLPAAAHPRRS